MHVEQDGDERVILIGAEAEIWTSGSLRKAGVMQDGVGSDGLLGTEGHLQHQSGALAIAPSSGAPWHNREAQEQDGRPAVVPSLCAR